jgi:hypothetical protein
LVQGKEDKMFQIKKSLVVLLIVCVWLAAASSQEQDDPRSIFWKPEPREGIHNGLVIAYGVKIPQPYFVTYKDDTTYINDVPFRPSRRDPSFKPRKIVVSELATLKHNYLARLTDSYVQYRKEYGAKKAEEMIQEQYGGDTLITELTFKGSDQLWVKWVKNGVEYIPLYDLMMRDAGLFPTEEEIRQNRIENIKYIEEILESDGTIAFGYNYETGFSVNATEEVLDIIRSVKEGKISISEGKKELHRKIHGGLVEDIFKNLDSWD